jgi:hypothetical protein
VQANNIPFDNFDYDLRDPEEYYLRHDENDFQTAMQRMKKAKPPSKLKQKPNNQADVQTDNQEDNQADNLPDHLANDTVS